MSFPKLSCTTNSTAPHMFWEGVCQTESRFYPEVYFRTLPEIEDLEDTDFDRALAFELFGPEFYHDESWASVAALSPQTDSPLARSPCRNLLKSLDSKDEIRSSRNSLQRLVESSFDSRAFETSIQELPVSPTSTKVIFQERAAAVASAALNHGKKDNLKKQPCMGIQKLIPFELVPSEDQLYVNEVEDRETPKFVEFTDTKPCLYQSDVKQIPPKSQEKRFLPSSSAQIHIHRVEPRQIPKLPLLGISLAFRPSEGPQSQITPRQESVVTASSSGLPKISSASSLVNQIRSRFRSTSSTDLGLSNMVERGSTSSLVKAESNLDLSKDSQVGKTKQTKVPSLRVTEPATPQNLLSNAALKSTPRPMSSVRRLGEVKDSHLLPIPKQKKLSATSTFFQADAEYQMASSRELMSERSLEDPSRKNPSVQNLLSPKNLRTDVRAWVQSKSSPRPRSNSSKQMHSSPAVARKMTASASNLIQATKPTSRPAVQLLTPAVDRSANPSSPTMSTGIWMPPSLQNLKPVAGGLGSHIISRRVPLPSPRPALRAAGATNLSAFLKKCGSSYVFPAAEPTGHY